MSVKLGGLLNGHDEALNVAKAPAYAAVQQKPCQGVTGGAPGGTQQMVVLARQRMRRDAAAMLYWALRWHEGRRVSYRVLSDLLWGEFALQPKDPAASLRELRVYVQKRHGDKWAIEDCSRGFRISPRSSSVHRKKAQRLLARPKSPGATQRRKVS